MPEASVTSTAGVERLWEVVGDLVRWPEHLPTFDSVTSTSEVSGTTGVGSSFGVKQPGLPAATYRITRWEPGAGFTWAARTPGVVTTADHRITPLEQGLDQGCRLDLEVTWQGPLAGLVRLLLSRRTQRMIESEAATLCAVAEGPAVANDRQEG